jgi:hypothetical protein
VAATSHERSDLVERFLDNRPTKIPSPRGGLRHAVPLP